MAFGELKEICNKLVGTWYCEHLDEEFTFYLNDSLWQTESKLTVINNSNGYKPFDLHYGVGVFLGEGVTDKTKFYIDIGMFSFNRKYYKIESITKDMLILRQYLQQFPVVFSESVVIYKRRTDSSKADEILQGLDLDE